ADMVGRARAARHRRPPLPRVAAAVVAVAVALQRDEAPAGSETPRIDGVGVGGGRGGPDQVAVGRLQHVLRVQAHPSASNSSRTTTRSSKGTVRSPIVWPASCPSPAITTTSP